MKCSLGTSDFLEEISRLSHYIVFLYYFALITEEGILMSPCYSLEFCIQMSIYFLFSFAFHFSSIHRYLWIEIAFLHFFSLRMVLIPASCTVSRTSIHTSSGTLSIRSNPLNLFVTSIVKDPSDVGNLISGSSAFSKSSLNIQKFSVHILLKSDSENFKHYFASMWNECNCAVVWTFFAIILFWDWNENWPFPVLWPLLIFLGQSPFWIFLGVLSHSHLFMI